MSLSGLGISVILAHKKDQEDLLGFQCSGTNREQWNYLAFESFVELPCEIIQACTSFWDSSLITLFLLQKSTCLSSLSLLGSVLIICIFIKNCSLFSNLFAQRSEKQWFIFLISLSQCLFSLGHFLFCVHALSPQLQSTFNIILILGVQYGGQTFNLLSDPPHPSTSSTTWHHPCLLQYY